MRVLIDGLPPETITTAIGPAEPSAFMPFGLLPVTFSSLDLRLPSELNCRFNWLLLTLHWRSVPANRDGFAGYYANYRINAHGEVTRRRMFDNRSFRVGFELVGQMPWALGPTGPQALFQTHMGVSEPSPAAPVLPVTRFVLPVEPAAGISEGEAALRICLTAPNDAFGHVLYASNVLFASAQMAKRAKWLQKLCKPAFPNPPFAPMIDAITLGCAI